MNSVCKVALMLSVGARALQIAAPPRFQHFKEASSSKASRVAHELLDKQCGSATEMTALAPVMRSMSEFFQEKEGVTAYPWALSALGAIRWGNLVLLDKNKSLTVDHDIDFLVQMKGKTPQDAIALVNGLKEHIRETTRLPAETPDENALVKGLKEHIRETTRLPADGYNEKDVKGATNSWHIPLTVHQKSAIADAGVVSGKVWVHGDDRLLIDLWFTYDDLGKDYRPSQKTQTLLMGSAFPFPENPDVIYKDLQGFFSGLPEMQKTKSLCKLRKPTGVLDEGSDVDIKPSAVMSNLVDTCGKILSDNGFASLQYCLDDDARHAK